MDEPGKPLCRHSRGDPRGRPAPFACFLVLLKTHCPWPPTSLAFALPRLPGKACPVLVQSLSIGMCGWTKNASEKSYNTVDVLGTHFMIRLDVVGAWN